jgi:hypothetical protein
MLERHYAKHADALAEGGFEIPRGLAIGGHVSRTGRTFRILNIVDPVVRRLRVPRAEAVRSRRAGGGGQLGARGTLSGIEPDPEEPA